MDPESIEQPLDSDTSLLQPEESLKDCVTRLAHELEGEVLGLIGTLAETGHPSERSASAFVKRIAKIYKNTQ